MTHRDAITKQVQLYSAKHPTSRFIGYNTVNGSRLYGTLSKVPKAKCLEMPVSENLMVAMAYGMALEGYWPVVCFERHDFLLLGLDALVNHVDKLPVMGRYKVKMIIRCVVGASSPLNPGLQHTQDYTLPLQLMLKYTPVYKPDTLSGYKHAWSQVGKSKSGAVVIIEERNKYDVQL